jgi:hypothetical protein
MDKELAMSVVKALGLVDDQVIALMVRRWPSWREQVPALGSLADPAGVDAWRRAADPAEVDAVLRGLAELAARDGGDDTDAATVLAWLLLPTAIRLSVDRGSDLPVADLVAGGGEHRLAGAEPGPGGGG